MSLRETLIAQGVLTPADKEYPNPISRSAHFYQYDWNRPPMSDDAIARYRMALIKAGVLKPRRIH